jgi:hypothetical protein
MSDPGPPGPYDPKYPNNPLEPTELSKTSIYGLQKGNIFHQYNDPKPLTNQSSVVSPPVTTLPIVRRRKPIIVRPAPNWLTTPTEYTSNFTSNYITPPPGPSTTSSSGPPRHTLPGVRPRRVGPTGGKRNTRRKHKKSRKTHRRRN